jgi:glutamine amidotransferase
MLTIAVIDVGMGNLRSVQKAIEHAANDVGVACEVPLVHDPARILAADKVVMPGQGAFRDCALALRGGVGEAVREQIRKGTQYLGICLGLQALFEDSEEAPGDAGLGVFPGRVERLPDGAVDAKSGEAVKIPHMGWNKLALSRRNAGILSVFEAEPPFVYFVHSYHAVPKDPSLVAATVDHGPYRITAAIQRDNVVATQFHPEKSQRAGLALLAAFVRA